MENNILIIGNGFDLYHNLPTRYTDFLTLVKNWDVFYNAMPKDYNFYKNYDSTMPRYKTTDIKLNGGKLDINAIVKFSEIDAFKYKLFNLQSLDKEVKENLWIKYFLRPNRIDQEYSWIDFENEIEKVILAVKRFYDILPTLLGQTIRDNFDDDTLDIIELFSKDIKAYPECLDSKLNRNDITPNRIHEFKKKIINTLKEQLDHLIQALRIYFEEFVDKIKIGNPTPAISRACSHKSLDKQVKKC